MDEELDLLFFAESAARDAGAAPTLSCAAAAAPLAGSSLGRDAGPLVDDDGGALVQALFEAGLDEDIVALAVAQVEPKRKYECRSWQLVRTARDAKAIKRLKTDLATVCADRDKKREQLDIVEAESRPSRVKLEPCTLALTKWRSVAQGPHRAVNSSRRSAMARASAQCALAIDCVQREAFQSSFLGRMESQASSSSQAHATERQTTRTHLYQHAMDSTTQRLQRFTKPSSRNLKFSFSQISQSVLMQNGYWVRCTLTASGGWDTQRDEWFCKPLVLESSKANAVARAMLKRFPLPLESPHEMRSFAEACDALIIMFCIDKCAVNFVIGSWVIELVAVNPTVGCHLEACGDHATAVVKSRGTQGGALSQAINTFSKLTRQSKFLEEFIDATGRFVMRTVTRAFRKRPHMYEERAQRLIRALQQHDKLDRDLEEGSRGPIEFKEPHFITFLKEYLKVINLGEEDKRTHFCYVEDCSVLLQLNSLIVYLR